MRTFEVIGAGQYGRRVGVRHLRMNERRAGNIWWGFMPDQLVANDVASGEVVQLKLAAWPDDGSAASWLLKRLIAEPG